MLTSIVSTRYISKIIDNQFYYALPVGGGDTTCKYSPVDALKSIRGPGSIRPQDFSSHLGSMHVDMQGGSDPRSAAQCQLTHVTYYYT